jgi:CxxC motif-containing protein (DUF1111 family)
MSFRSSPIIRWSFAIAIIGALSIALTAVALHDRTLYDPSVNEASERAFSQPLADLTQEQQQSAVIGKSLFHEYAIENKNIEQKGIGPAFSALSCSDCHARDGRGNPDDSPSLAVKLYNPTTDSGGDPTYGQQLQLRHVTESLRETSLDRVSLTSDVQQSLQRGPLDNNTRMYFRIAPSVFGAGLIESIPEEWFYSQQDPFDKNDDGISGRIGWVDKDTKTIGRFGWKATQPNVFSQALLAAHEDLGVTNSLFPACAADQSQCTIKNDITQEQEQHLVFYTRSLAPPRQRETRGVAAEGEQLFISLGCAQCHSPQVPVEQSDVIKVKKGEIAPYSDFLLHNMGRELADATALPGREADEFRTAPLWGLGLIEKVNGSLHLLHDGRATTIDQAIRFHGGEAQQSRDLYRGLPRTQRQAVIAYLESL